MENEKYTPNGWHWKITPEQIEKIKERDRDTLNQVYFDNLPKFKRIAYRFCRDSKNFRYYQDCYQQIYADLLDYDFSDVRTLYRSLFKSFRKACLYNRAAVISLNTPISDDKSIVLGDIIPSQYNADTYSNKRDNERRILEVINEQTHLTDIERDYLTACAFGCLAYQGLFAYEYNKLCTA